MRRIICFFTWHQWSKTQWFESTMLRRCERCDRMEFCRWDRWERL